MTTIQERLRLFALILKRTPRMIYHGMFVDELIIAAADEIQNKEEILLRLSNGIVERDKKIEALQSAIKTKDEALQACSGVMVDCVDKMRIAREAKALYGFGQQRSPADHSAEQETLDRSKT